MRKKSIVFIFLLKTEIVEEIHVKFFDEEIHVINLLLFLNGLFSLL